MNQPEKKILTTCARVTLSEKDRATLRENVAGIPDWQDLIQAALRHGLLPLLYTHLKSTCPDLVPPEVLEHLKRAYVALSTRNLSISSALLKILNLFTENDIPALPFKGPVLAEQIYGDVGLRQFGDLDILIRKEDALRAEALLNRNGYASKLSLSGKAKRRYLDFENSFSFYSEKGLPEIDLHWEMSGRYLLAPLTLESFGDRLSRTSLLGQKVPCLPEDVLAVYLCAHGTSHLWERLEWLGSFSELLRRQSAEKLAGILAMAEGLRCRRMLYLSVYLCHTLLGLDLPASFMNAAGRDAGVVRAGKNIGRIMFGIKTHSGEDAAWRFSSIHIQLRDTLAGRLKYALYLYTAPTEKEWLKVPLPAFLTPLYRIIRPFRLGLSFLLNTNPRNDG